MSIQIVYTCTGKWVDIKPKRPRDRQVVMVETKTGKRFLSEYSATSDKFYPHSLRDSTGATDDIVRWSPVIETKRLRNNANSS